MVEKELWMKNLTKKYKKIQLQKLKVIVNTFNNKIMCEYGFNLIGFDNEIFFPEEYNQQHYFNNYIHNVMRENNKLYKKYPQNVYKEKYKEWLKRNYT